MTEQVAVVEHLEDFTAHEWCNTLLSDPAITHISKRHVHGQRDGVSNTFFTRTLFTDTALRAFLSLYKPGKGRKREPGEEVFTGNAPLHEVEPRNIDNEAQRQKVKEEKLYDVNDLDAPEALILVSLGKEVDGGIRRLHGGVTATLLDQVMGTLISYVYEHTCATSDLNVKYKQAISTPCILLVRAKIVREKGRWIETRGWIEDGKGTIFAEGWGAFVMSKVGEAKI
ncbi:HotDog domain-containing protein [Phaeosphaeria sp. MPI-PUGE-AT-0046c]|nr:HotDog domain-containing protein [Phaeosphaeria sp. MPI-PUGE-AT-0046c]